MKEGVSKSAGERRGTRAVRTEHSQAPKMIIANARLLFLMAREP